VVSAWGGGFGLQAVIARKSVVHTQVPASLCPYSDILDENEVRLTQFRANKKAKERDHMYHQGG